MAFPTAIAIFAGLIAGIKGLAIFAMFITVIVLFVVFLDAILETRI
jgi:hypothetical protein